MAIQHFVTLKINEINVNATSQNPKWDYHLYKYNPGLKLHSDNCKYIKSINVNCKENKYNSNFCYEINVTYKHEFAKLTIKYIATGMPDINIFDIPFEHDYFHMRNYGIAVYLMERSYVHAKNTYLEWITQSNGYYYTKKIIFTF